METLRKKKDFDRVFCEGRKVDLPPIRMWFLQKESGSLRVCFVGRSKKAVRRNRIRRRLREAFRQYFYDRFREKPVDVIFFSDERLLSEDFKTIVEKMARLLDENLCGQGELL
ncbi:ribonuclease P protein component [Thermatribacter velox]|jgi:ribonuclease P protein component|uniref:Ribonuclease P protein component n=1 Tax=Thermatribacter velox TaxID=3039681 RepID=A0ABZ2YEG8_9BACT